MEKIIRELELKLKLIELHLEGPEEEQDAQRAWELTLECQRLAGRLREA